MSNLPKLSNRVREERQLRGWSQDELAKKCGISRAGVSAVETGRLVPSAAAALTMAAAMDCRVEDLFRLADQTPVEAGWAWPPRAEPCRYWQATVSGRLLRYPVEQTLVENFEHDGVYRDGTFQESSPGDPERTVVVACCDPAVGLLARELGRLSGLRLLVLPRSSRLALDLLRQRLVHAAGVHLAKAGDRIGNAQAVREMLGSNYGLLRVARWQEGLALSPGRQIRSAASALRAKLRWVGREEGSGARQCLDELLHDRRTPRRNAFDHRGVAEAIRCGWADAGVCLRLVCEEAGLDFIRLRDEAYDLCLPSDQIADAPLKGLVEAVRSLPYRHRLGELPGYDTSESGQWQRVP
jgi:molybdate-binding protein/DNA-binding XRE family transcriptional regulator